MNSSDLYKAISDVDDDILERSEVAPRGGMGKKSWVKWVAIAACLCLAIAGAAMWERTAPAQPEGSKITVSEDGVTIPPMEVTLAADVEADMIGFFIYQGRCYVQYGGIDGNVDILGEYLGTATGLIDEWTPKEGYVELAGSVKGDFYTVKGYDPSFMLCMKESTGSISTYICNSGITLKYGSELYEDRLHLSDGIRVVEYESRFSWYYSKGELFQMDQVGEVVTNFIRDLDCAQFVPCDSIPLSLGQTAFADTELYHMYFRMKDGNTVLLRLHENGYVRFDGMWALCVQVPAESYDALLALLDSHTDSVAVEGVSCVGPTLEDCLNYASFGSYVPSYVPAGFDLGYADIYHYPDHQSVDEISTGQIWLDYANSKNMNSCYSIVITWVDEHKQFWSAPLLSPAELNVESIMEHMDSNSGSLELALQLDKVAIVIIANGMDAETVYQIMSSVQ